VGDADDLVVDLRVEHPGYEARSEPLLLVRTGAASREHRALGRLDSDDCDRRLLLAQVTSGAGDRAAGADSGDEHVDAAGGVFPDLRSGRAVVNLGVGGVVEL